MHGQRRGVREKRWRIGAWCLILCFGLPASTRAAIFQYRDANGVLTFTDIPPQNRDRSIGGHQQKGRELPASSRQELHALMRQSEQLARKYGLNPRLVQAVITVESNFDVDAVSFAGAQGLMQLMPATSQAYGIRNPFDPAENLAGGIRHLRDLLEHFAGNLSLALAAYNAGTAAVEKFQGIPPFSETQTYVQRVLRLYKGNRGVQKRPQVFQYTDKEHGLILLTDTPLYGDRKTKLFPQREQGVGTQ